MARGLEGQTLTIVPPSEDHGPFPIVGRVAKSSAWNVLAFVITAGGAFGVSIIIARSLGPQDFGNYSYLVWLIRTAVVLGALGVPAAVGRMVSERLGSGELGKSKQYYHTSLRFHLLIAPLLGFVVVGVAWTKLHDPLVVLALGFAAIFGSFAYTMEQTLAGFRRFQVIARIALVLAIAQFISLGVVALTRAGLNEFLFIYGLMATLGFFVWTIELRSAFSGPKAARFSKDETRKFFKLAAIMALIALSDTILWGRPEVFFLERFWSESHVGFYTAAWVLATLTSSLPLIASRVLTPEFAWLRGGGKYDELAAAFPAICTYLAVIAVPLGIGGAVVAGDLLVFAYGAPYVSATTAAAIVMAGSVFVSVAGPASAAAVTGPRPEILARLAGIFAIVNIGLDLALIPTWGIMGASIAAISSQAISVVLVISHVHRKLGLLYPVKKIFQIVGLTLVIAVPVRLAFSGVSHPLRLFLTVGSVALIYVPLVLLLKVIRVEDLKRMRSGIESPRL